MQLQVLQENLNKALSITSRFASTRAQLPVLANVLFKAHKNKLLVSATNLELSIALSVGAKVEDGGEITVPAKIITDLVSNLSAGSVNLETKKEQVKIKSGNFSSVVSGMNAADFPEVPTKVGKDSFDLPTEDLKGALDKTLFAVSIDETRPVLTGVLLVFDKKSDKDSLLVVATDGFRLSRKRLRFKKGKVKKEKLKLILPKNALSELSRLSSDDESIQFSYSEKDSQTIFAAGSAVLSSRIIEGEFPDYEKIIPEKSNVEIDVDKEELLQAVKLSSVFARDSANVVKISVTKDSLKLSAESSQSGRQETQVAAKITEDELEKKPFDIAFNYRFLEEFLQSVEGEDVTIKFSDANSPGIFLDANDQDFLHIIMPVKLQS